QPHYFLGNLALKKGKVDEAEDHYRKSLAVNGEYVLARTALAEILLNRGMLNEARDEIRKALGVQPGYVDARLVEARLDVAQKDFEGAERHLIALKKEQPNNGQVERQLAFYYANRGRKGEAEKSFLRALELMPDSEDLLQAAAQFYVQNK